MFKKIILKLKSIKYSGNSIGDDVRLEISILEKYLHTGRHSLGCITVLEQDHWDEIFYQLIKARKGDGLSVGVLSVVE